MSHFEYVPKKKYRVYRDKIIEIIKLVQNDLRKVFTFQFRPTGSLSLNLVTYDRKTNKGYDLDYNLIPNHKKSNLPPKQIKDKFIESFNKFTKKYGFDFSEDSTNVLTIKIKDTLNSKIIFSCDFAIVDEYFDKEGRWRQKILHHDKDNDVYKWQEREIPFYDYYDKIKEIKKMGCWHQVRKLYLFKKNNNKNENKKSSSLRIEAVNEVYQSIMNNKGK